MPQKSSPEKLEKIRECTSCGVPKPLSAFPIDKKRKDGVRAQCKLCRQAVNRIWKEANPGAVARHNKNWRESSPGHGNEYMRNYRTVKPEIIAKIRKNYNHSHKESIKEYRKRWRLENREKYLESRREQSKKYRAKNKERVAEVQRKSQLKRRLDPGVVLHQRMSCAVYLSLKRNKQGRRWEELLGFTCAQLKTHIEKLFLPGMSWENIGEWHIDHKIPKAVFNFSSYSDIDFKKCWDIKNLQPLWSVDNLKKNNKLSKPHQPSLALG
ncbi:MAG: hypothetical protein WC294_00205 [Methanoregula sp.]